MNFYLLVTEELCLGCGNCVAVCPVNALAYPGGEKKKTLQCTNGSASIHNISMCNGCGLCLRACPSKALSMVVRKNPVGSDNFEVIVLPHNDFNNFNESFMNLG